MILANPLRVKLKVLTKTKLNKNKTYLIITRYIYLGFNNQINKLKLETKWNKGNGLLNNKYRNQLTLVICTCILEKEYT